MKIKIAMDGNGNKIAKFMPINGRGFGVQTNGNLPKIHRLEVGEDITAKSSIGLWIEFIDYVKEFGTAQQKRFFGC